jgi:hypothetical protein
VHHLQEYVFEDGKNHLPPPTREKLRKPDFTSNVKKLLQKTKVSFLVIS